MSYLGFLYLFVHIVVFFVLFFVVLCLVYPIVSVPLDWPFCDCPFGVL